MENLFLSVIIPTLNEELYIGKLLSDLVKQKQKNFEVIVIDGNSEDTTTQIVESFADKLTLKCKSVKKRNVSYQRNFGAENAKGNYLVFLDADTRINSLFIKNLTKFIQIKKGLVFLPYVDPEEDSAQIQLFYQFINFIIDISQNTNKPLSSVGGMVWNSAFFQAVGGFEEKLYISEDMNIIQKANLWGVKAKFMPRIKIKFSFRRIKREGKLQSLYKLFMGTYHVLFKGDIKKKIFEYEMGGQLYNKKFISSNLNKKSSPEFIHKIKETFNALMLEN